MAEFANSHEAKMDTQEVAAAAGVVGAAVAGAGAWAVGKWAEWRKVQREATAEDLELEDTRINRMKKDYKEREAQLKSDIKEIKEELKVVNGKLAESQAREHQCQINMARLEVQYGSMKTAVNEMRAQFGLPPMVDDGGSGLHSIHWEKGDGDRRHVRFSPGKLPFPPRRDSDPKPSPEDGSHDNPE